jgi:hypothetical protein
MLYACHTAAQNRLCFHSLRDEVSRSGGVNVEDFAFTVGAPELGRVNTISI